MSAHAINLGEIELNTNSKVCLKFGSLEGEERGGEWLPFPYTLIQTHCKCLPCKMLDMLSNDSSTSHEVEVSAIGHQ